MIYTPMTTILPEGARGGARIEHFTVSAAESAFTQMRAAATGRRREYVPAGDYVRLLIDGELYMTDTRAEQMENHRFITAARGDVLVAGLGIGMVIPPLLAKTEVTGITVVEINPDVIALVAPAFRGEKLRIVHGDILNWGGRTGERWHTIYFDIWSSLCADDQAEIHELYVMYEGNLHLSGWMGHWGQREGDRCR
jgi:hypothetical protein